MKFIGLDIGTTTICAVCINEEGQLLLSKTLPNSSHVIGELYEALQSPQAILENCRQLITELSEPYEDITAIGISNQMHGILYVDEKGEAISPLYTWQDERGNLNASEEETYCKKLSRITGYPMATGFGLTTHYYNCINSNIPKGAAKLCTIGDYVAMQLCGRKTPIIHTSNAASLGLFDMNGMQFDEEALNKAGINSNMLPVIANREEFLGKTEAGILVSVALGDNQASVFGALQGQGRLHINVGTSSQISLVSDTFTKAELVECRPYLMNKYLLVGAPLCGGFSYHMLKSFFEEAAYMMGVGPVESLYEKMNQAGLEAYRKGVDGLRVDTRFRGTRTQPSLRGSITGISQDNFKPENLVAALLKGICEELLMCFDSIQESAEYDGPIYASGNGIRLNPLLVRLMEDTFHRKLIVSDNVEEAAAGAAKVSMSVYRQSGL